MLLNFDFSMLDSLEEKVSEILINPSTIETIDTAIFSYIKDKTNLFVFDENTNRKVPVYWVGSERSFQIKADPELRDENRSLIYPLVTIERTGVTKEKDFKGAFQANFPDKPGAKRTAVPIARRILQDKTNNFASATSSRLYNKDPNFPRTNKKIVYQTVYAPIPVYVKAAYSVTMITNYQIHMNTLITPFFTRTGQNSVTSVKADGHRYEVFIDGNFKTDNNVKSLEANERVFKTTIDFNVLGYLIGDGPNDERPKFSIYENVVEVKLPRENVITMTNNTTTKKSFYRE